LLRRVNHYVTHADLMAEIWDDEFADTSLLRAGVQRLRVKLRLGGMADLARAITGHHGRYMLDMSLISRHADVTAVSHRTSQT
jgi:DNA-binding response OmpR family regulator